MGAVLIHGRELRKSDGRGVLDIVPVDGDYAFPAYSSIKALVDYSRDKGIEDSLWPIYYDVLVADVDMEDISRRCERIVKCLSRLSEEDISRNHWLRRIADWLRAGEEFCITE